MRKAIWTTVMLFAAGAATAADNGLYLGLAVGNANLEIDDVGFTSEDFKGDDTGYKFIVGIRPLDWLAVEASYVNFGEPEDRVAGIPVEAEGDGFSGFAVGFLPVGPVDVFAKAGLVAWDSEIGGFSDDGSDFAYGVGAQVRFLSLAARAEYEIFDVDDVDDLSMISIGITYTFL